MNEEHNTINQQREIVWVDGSGNLHNITKVVYSDPYRATHTIWPCTIELRDVQIVKLSKNGQASDVAYEYHVDTNTLIPNVSLVPGEVYSVKGTVDVYSRPGELEKRIKNCYFFPETISSSLDPESHPFLAPTGNEAYAYGSRTAKAYDANDNYLGEDYVSDYSQYVKWGVTSDLEKTGRIELQGGWYNERLGYVQNGYIFDGNYATRMIFRRATLAQDIVLSKISGNNISSSDVLNNPVLLDINQSVTFWPKFHKRVNDSTAAEAWEEYWDANLSLSDFSYDSNTFTIVKNSNGSWTVTPISYTGGLGTITISSEGYSYELRIVCQPNVIYLLMSQGNVVPAGSTITMTNILPLWIRADNQSTGQSEEYTGSNYQFHTSNSSVAAIDGSTIIPVGTEGSTAEIWAEVEGLETQHFNVEIGNVNTYYKFGLASDVDSSPLQLLPSSLSVNISVGQLYVMKFFIDSIGNYERTVYYNTVQSDNIYVQPSGGMLTITSSGSGASVSVPIYPTSSKTAGTELTTLTITRS